MPADPPEPRRRRRRRWKLPAFAALVVLVYVFAGDPYGIYSEGAGPRRPVPGVAEQGPAGPVGGASGPTAETVGESSLTGASDPQPGEKPGQTTVPSLTLPPATHSTPRSRPDAPPGAVQLGPSELDAARSRVLALEAAVARQDLARVAALAPLAPDLLRRLPVELGARARKARAGAGELLDCGPRVRALLQQGAWLEVHRLLAGVHGRGLKGGWVVRLRAYCVEQGWPDLLSVGVVPGASAPAALPRGRQVRVEIDGQQQRLAVARDDGRYCSLRRPEADGFSFPRRPRQLVVPVEPSTADLRAQLQAALHAEDGLAAALWWVLLRQRDAAAAARMRDQLRG